MPTTLEHPYTRQQWDDLNKDQRQVVRAVAQYLSGDPLPEQPTEENLSESLNLLRPCHGCVPEEEIDGNTAKVIRRKFAAVYWPGIELAVQDLQRQGLGSGQEFTFNLVIDASPEDYTQVAVVDETRSVCFLHEGHKAWHFKFDSLAVIANAVLAVRRFLVNKVRDRQAKQPEIFVVLRGGLVEEVVDLPPGFGLTVVDYDTEGVDDERLQKSPLDGQPCCLNHF